MLLVVPRYSLEEMSGLATLRPFGGGGIGCLQRLRIFAKCSAAEHDMRNHAFGGQHQ
jgi:hypothetical protein